MVRQAAAQVVAPAPAPAAEAWVVVVAQVAAAVLAQAVAPVVVCKPDAGILDIYMSFNIERSFRAPFYLLQNLLHMKNKL